MLRRRVLWIAGFVAALAATASLEAQEGRNWAALGQAHVDKTSDHDRIKVHHSQESFRAIRFRVEGGNVEFDRIKVHFRNGMASDRLMHVRLESGAESKVLDLPGGRRMVDSVEIWYRKDSSQERPTVTLYALR